MSKRLCMPACLIVMLSELFEVVPTTRWSDCLFTVHSVSPSSVCFSATLVHRSLPDISPSYIADDCRLVADARERRLRSTRSWTCVVNLWRGHTAPSAIEHLQLLDPDYGTVFHYTWKRQTNRTIISAVAKDIFVWTVGPRRSVKVNHFNCAV